MFGDDCRSDGKVCTLSDGPRHGISTRPAASSLLRALCGRGLIRVLIVLIMLIFGSNMGSVILALCFTSWIGTARVVRSEVMYLKHSEYVLASRLAGASTWHLLIHHLIPNAMGPIIVSTAFLIPGAIFSEAFLSFLGIGIQAPQASWGSLANAAIPVMQMYPHLMLFPVIAICITMFSFNFIGDGLRDALDPRLKK